MIGNAPLVTPYSNEEYTIGWICALPIEFKAANFMLDQAHGRPQFSHPQDDNVYHLGEIAGHNVVIVVLAEMGTTAATKVAVDLKKTFTKLRCSFLVGVGGGVPNGRMEQYITVEGQLESREADIRLGDVCVGTPSGAAHAVLQLDRGKAEKDGFKRGGILNGPSRLALGAVNFVRSDDRESKLLDIAKNELPLFDKEAHAKFLHPGTENDVLYEHDYVHQSSNIDDSCDKVCDKTKVVKREPRRNLNPKVHFGPIGSGNAVIKNGELREQYRKEHDIICVEMEAAGVVNFLECIVVRGVCDYSDSHKNKRWQPYAALMAATFTRELIRTIAPLKPKSSKDIAPSVRHTLPHTRTFDFPTSESRPRTSHGSSNHNSTFGRMSDRNLSSAPSIRNGSESFPMKDFDPFSPAMPQAVYYLPLKRNIEFIGHSELLSTIEYRILSHMGLGCSKIALMGMGGVGKTQIAIEAAYRVLENPDHAEYSIFWVTATSPDAFLQSYRQIAKCLGIWRKGKKVENLGKSVKEHLENTSRRWLLFLDNADDPDLWIQSESTVLSSKSRYLGDYIPLSLNGSIIITTSSNKIARTLTNFNSDNRNSVLDVPELEEAQACQIFRNRLDKLASERIEDSKALQLVKTLSSHPLALIQAASYLNGNIGDTSVSDYLTTFSETKADAEAMLSEDFNDQERYSKTTNSCAVTWLVSFEHVLNSNKHATKLLLMLACLSNRDRPDGIPSYLLPVPSCKSPTEAQTQFKKAMNLLEKLSFIQHIKRTPVKECVCRAAPKNLVDYYSVNRLVGIATLKWLYSNSFEKIYDITKELAVSVISSPHIRLPPSFGYETEYAPPIIDYLNEDEFHQEPEDPLQQHRKAILLKFCSWLEAKEIFFKFGEQSQKARRRWLSDVRDAITPERVQGFEDLNMSLGCSAKIAAGGTRLIECVEDDLVVDFTSLDGKLSEDDVHILERAYTETKDMVTTIVNPQNFGNLVSVTESSYTACKMLAGSGIATAAVHGLAFIIPSAVVSVVAAPVITVGLPVVTAVVIGAYNLKGTVEKQKRKKEEERRKRDGAERLSFS